MKYPYLSYLERVAPGEGTVVCAGTICTVDISMCMVVRW